MFQRLICLFALAVLLPAGAFADDEPLVIRFSHVVAADTPKGKAAMRFKTLAERYSEGRVVVEVYPDGTLYRDHDEMAALQLGAVQIIAPSLAKFGVLGLRSFEVFDLPFIFNDFGDLHRVTGGPVGKALFKALERRGIRGLAYWDNGFKVFSANRPIDGVDDFAGLRMRTQASQVIEAQMRALGAEPQVMGFSDVFDALASGVVDGTENPPSNLYSKAMHTVQSHVLVSNHGYLGYAVITNREFWDGLSRELRTALERAMSEATAYANSIAREENARALDAVRRAGTTKVIELDDAAREALKTRLLEVHVQMAERIGQDVIEAVYDATRFDRRELMRP